MSLADSIIAAMALLHRLPLDHTEWSGLPGATSPPPAFRQTDFLESFID